MTTALLELRKLAVSFATDDGIVQAVDGIDLALRRGRTLGLVGESGCGKSVTSLAVMGLLPPENSTVSGEVQFEGRDLLKIRGTSCATCAARGSP
jgi:ABC-type dipeptide/oligopeptide/nickel transport system ATPase component